MKKNTKKAGQSHAVALRIAPVGHVVYDWLNSMHGHYAVGVLWERGDSFEEIAEIFQVEPRAIESVILGN